MAIAVVDGEDDLSATWDLLSPHERLEASRLELAAALDSMRRGDVGPRVRAKADASLTVLRAEMYSTDAGRAEHRRLEAEVDGFLRRAADTAEIEVAP